MAPQTGKRVVVTSWDDSTASDLKVASMLERYKVKGTFFVITKNINHLISVDDLVSLAARFEIGSHSVNHPNLTKVDESLLSREVTDSKNQLQSMLNREVHSFSYPYGNYDKRVIAAVRSAGYGCARTYDPYDFAQPTNPMSVNIGVWAQPHGFLYDRGKQNTLRLLRLLSSRVSLPRFVSTAASIRSWVRLSKTLFDLFLEDGEVFHLVGHPWWFDSNGEWGNLEEVLSYISNRNQVQYMSFGEYCINR